MRSVVLLGVEEECPALDVSGNAALTGTSHVPVGSYTSVLASVFSMEMGSIMMHSLHAAANNWRYLSTTRKYTNCPPTPLLSLPY